ncbi:MAG: HK97 family phage prohead protease [Gordonia paraffinivorans]
MQHKSVIDALIKADAGNGLADGEFTAYAAVFGSKDSHGDVVEPGAFAGTLADWSTKGTPIPLLFSHRMDDPDYNIGHIVEAVEDDHGLKVRGLIDLESPKGAHVHRLVKSGRVTNLSFAYDVLDAAPVKSDQHGDYQSLKSLALHEVSIVPIGANRETAFVSVKAATTTKGDTMNKTLTEQRAEAMTKAENLAATAKAGDLTDEQKTELSGLVESVKSFDAEIAKQLSSTALVEAVAALKGEPAKPAETEKSTGVVSTKRHVSFYGKSARTAAGSLAKAMLGGVGTKSLVAAGSTIVGVPLEEKTPIEEKRIPTSFLDLLPAKQHQTPSYTYLRQSARDMNAAPWTLGQKPESSLQVESVDGSLVVIPHITDGLSTYDLLDNDELAAFVEAEMLHGLRQAVEAQVLAGNGTAPNMRGVLNTAGIVNQPYSVDPITTTRKAITLLEASGHTPAVFVLRPETWEAISLQRAAGSGTFDLGNVAVDRAAQRLHGVPVVVSTALASKVGVLLDSTAVRVDLDTRGVQVTWGTVGNDFAENLIRARVEGRFGVSVLRPGGVVKIATAPAS